MYRKTAVAGQFYPQKPQECLQSLQECLQDVSKSTLKNLVAGIVPHAGWSFSGNTAARVFHAILQDQSPKTFVILGAVHVPGVRKACIWSRGSWQTPLGDVEIEEELAKNLLYKDWSIFEENFLPHFNEHSIEVEIPFIKHLFPQAKIVPVMVPATFWADKIGEYLADIVDSSTIVLASTDLTHYGSRFGFTPAGVGEEALAWVKKENDKRMLDMMLSLQSETIVDEAWEHQNACGAGAVAATLAFAKARGKQQGELLHYTTSWDVYPEKEIDNFVGYSGSIF